MSSSLWIKTNDWYNRKQNCHHQSQSSVKKWELLYGMFIWLCSRQTFRKYENIIKWIETYFGVCYNMWMNVFLVVVFVTIIEKAFLWKSYLDLFRELFLKRKIFSMVRRFSNSSRTVAEHKRNVNVKFGSPGSGNSSIFLDKMRRKLS